VTDADRKRLAIMLGMLGSSHAGERDAAGLQIEALRRKYRITWDEFLLPQVATPEPTPPPPEPPKQSSPPPFEWAPWEPVKPTPWQPKPDHSLLWESTIVGCVSFVALCVIAAVLFHA